MVREWNERIFPQLNGAKFFLLWQFRPSKSIQIILFRNVEWFGNLEQNGVMHVQFHSEVDLNGELKTSCFVLKKNFKFYNEKEFVFWWAWAKSKSWQADSSLFF